MWVHCSSTGNEGKKSVGEWVRYAVGSRSAKSRKITRINWLSPNVSSLETVKPEAEHVPPLLRTPLQGRDTSVQISHHVDCFQSSFPSSLLHLTANIPHPFKYALKSMTLCRQVCPVRLGIEKGKTRSLLLHDILHGASRPLTCICSP